MSQWAKDYITSGDPKRDAVETWVRFRDGKEWRLRTTLIYAIPEMRRGIGANMPGFDATKNTDLEFLTWEFQNSPPKLNIDCFFLRANDFEAGDAAAPNTALRRGAASKSAVVREVTG
jgi:hypothetical protein